MAKLMIAVRGDASALLTAENHRPLADAGVTRLQVNLVDGDVDGALRIPFLDPAVDALVSLWIDGDVAPNDQAGLVRSVADTLALDVDLCPGWEVEEREPIVPPTTPDGVRLDALANVALLRRPEELEEAEWRHRWQVDHTPVAIATQGTFGYVQNRVVRSVTPQAPPIAAIVEEHFPMAALTDVHAFYGSGGDDTELGDRMTRLMTSVGRFGADRDIELVPTSRYCFALA
ncbi:EthD domain-containing protein [Nocardioides sp. R-C-SC26]|uniref:EthD domain-containing protein n=1 Tax=Nocardioides sp. R-C-SC26 TaxID=2870414 RepID=UPI001E596FF0|nr:EthD domain-containing protein [Nocardioides sp. R-C-SC26]